MNQNLYQESLGVLPLGKTVEYPDTYTPSLLEAVPRSLNRNPLGIGTELPFHGEDIWNAFEFSWLNPKGKPVVALLECSVPANTPNIIESKSFKLYLNSFNEDKFDSADKVHELLVRDLSHCADGEVTVSMNILGEQDLPVDELSGDCIDNLDVEITKYQPAPELLTVTPQKTVEQTLVSHLLKSNCLITNQPDWGSVQIHYIGAEINPESLLKYIVSFRKHNEFHEQCVERIFCDISEQCKPEKLSVLARYTRRGGLDINPFRSNFEDSPGNIRLIRQ